MKTTTAILIWTLYSLLLLDVNTRNNLYFSSLNGESTRLLLFKYPSAKNPRLSNSVQR